jgi:hypothetical protein
MNITPTVELIKDLVVTSHVIVVKKLSNNDRGWADTPPRNHQNGPYIPADIRRVAGFPDLIARTDIPHILERELHTVWIRSGEVKTSRLVHYSNKGQECHLTGVPKDEFAGIGPASFILMARQNETEPPVFSCLVVDSSETEACDYLEILFEIGPDFEAGIFSGIVVKEEVLEDLASQIIKAISAGSIADFVAGCVFPTTLQLAQEAQTAYLAKSGLASLNPFILPSPGDALMHISREMELHLYKQYHTRFYAARLSELLTAGETKPTFEYAIRKLVAGFEQIYKEVMLSSVQRLKSRSGYSFEHHVQRMLTDGKVPFDAQKFTGNQRPDFILPSKKLFAKKERTRDEVFILSLKTVLRERWKQVLKEAKTCDVFLATIDDKVAAEAIADMRDDGIYLVVPESLKSSKYAEYKDSANVITFKEFFESEIAVRRKPLWIANSVLCEF